MAENAEFLKFDRREGVATVTLARPEKLNAINADMHERLLDFFRSVSSDPSVSVVVLTGEGRAFCAGGDVSEMPGAEGAQVRPRQPLRLVSRPLIEAMLSVEQPIIASVNGLASGLGATLALFCDIVIAADTSSFTDSHVTIGLVAGDGGSVIWPLLVGMSRAKEALMLGDRVSAEDALRIGLINHLVPSDELAEATTKLADRLAAQPSFAMRATKASINRRLLREYDDVMDASGAWQLISLQSQEHKDALAALAARRAAKK